MTGFIYIMSNDAFASQIKIGKCDSHPKLRKRELDSATGVPRPFTLEYFAQVENHHVDERKIHRHFDDRRPNPRREFFEAPVEEAIAVIRSLCSVSHEEVFHKTHLEIAAEEKRLRIEQLREVEKERAAEEHRRSLAEWIDVQNKPILRTRDKFEAAEISEARQKYAFIGVVATLVSAAFFANGGVILVGILSMVAYGFLVSDAKLSASQEAAQKYPLRTEDDYKSAFRSTDRANPNHLPTFPVCPKCSQKVNVPHGRNLRIKCPTCAHDWTQQT